MRPSQHQPISTATASSSGTADIKTLTPPTGAAAMLISAETTTARATFDGTDPSAGLGSHEIVKDQNPIYIPLGVGCFVKFVSTAAAASVVQITWLR